MELHMGQKGKKLESCEEADGYPGGEEEKNLGKDSSEK